MASEKDRIEKSKIKKKKTEPASGSRKSSASSSSSSSSSKGTTRKIREPRPVPQPRSKQKNPASPAGGKISPFFPPPSLLNPENDLSRASLLPGTPQGTRFRKVLDILKKLYPETPSMLHYDGNPFRLLIAVSLSAQTTDAGVNKVTPGLFKLYPGPAELAEAPLPRLEEILHSLGFFRVKAKNIKACARLLQDRHNGQVPAELEELIRLPGIGRKSAHVLRAHIWNKPGIIVDTHFKRVITRLGLCSYPDPAKIEKDLASRLSPADHTPLSMMVNYHGRALCKSAKPLCPECPLKPYCPSAPNFL